MRVIDLIHRLQDYLENNLDSEYAVEEYAILIGDKYGTDITSMSGGKPNLYDRLPGDVPPGMRRVIVILPEEKP